MAVAEVRGPENSRRRRRRNRALSLARRTRVRGRRQEKLHQSAHPDELAKTGRGLETSDPRVDQALIPPPRRYNQAACAEFAPDRHAKAGTATPSPWQSAIFPVSLSAATPLNSFQPPIIASSRRQP